MQSFHISFFNLPVSKDDSFIGLPQAELIDADVDSTEEGQTKKYVIEPTSPEWKQQLGRIELSRYKDQHWRLISGTDLVEGVFPRIIEAIEDVESSRKSE